MVVNAAQTSQSFGKYGVFATATLSTTSGWATASTTPTTSYSSVTTNVRFVGSKWWGSGSTSAQQSASGLTNPTQAESYHYIDSYSTYLTVAYY